MASHGDDLSWRTLGAMTYLDAVVKEAQRVLPAANGSFRQLLSPLTVAGESDWSVIKGCSSRNRTGCVEAQRVLSAANGSFWQLLSPLRWLGERPERGRRVNGFLDLSKPGMR